MCVVLIFGVLGVVLSTSSRWYGDNSNYSERDVVFRDAGVKLSDVDLYESFTTKAMTWTVYLHPSGDESEIGRIMIEAEFGKMYPDVDINGTSLTPPTPPSGKNFLGYYNKIETSGGTQFYDVDMNPVQSVGLVDRTTFYARYIDKKYLVTLNHNNGTGGTTPFHIDYEDLMPTDLNKPEWNGHTFLGYWDQESGGEQYYTDEMVPIVETFLLAKNTTLYARWEANEYNVTLDQNGGTGESIYIKATYDLNMPTTDINGDVIISPTPPEGKNFLGFYDSTEVDNYGNPTAKQYYSSDMSSSVTYDVADDLTLYAMYEDKLVGEPDPDPVRTIVTLHKNDGTFEDFKIFLNDDGSFPLEYMDIPTRSGYTFMGYFDDIDGTVKYIGTDGNDGLTQERAWDSDQDGLFAHWEKIPAVDPEPINIVALDNSGATGGSDYVMIDADGNFDLNNISIPTYTNYVFKGYYGYTANDTVLYIGIDKYGNLTQIIPWDGNGDKLFAQWEEESESSHPGDSNNNNNDNNNDNNNNGGVVSPSDNSNMMIYVLVAVVILLVGIIVYLIIKKNKSGHNSSNSGNGANG